jgi:hypothetical protein
MQTLPHAADYCARVLDPALDAPACCSTAPSALLITFVNFTLKSRPNSTLPRLHHSLFPIPPPQAPPLSPSIRLLLPEQAPLLRPAPPPPLALALLTPANSTHL